MEQCCCLTRRQTTDESGAAHLLCSTLTWLVPAATLIAAPASRMLAARIVLPEKVDQGCCRLAAALPVLSNLLSV